MPSSAKSSERTSGVQEFDPYAQWLDIPPERRPPTHYDLLGLPVLEDDPEAIRLAAFDRLAHVRKYQISQHGEQALRLLDELSKAYVCLTDPALKQQYDRQFRALATPTGSDWSAEESGWMSVVSTYPRAGEPLPAAEPPAPAAAAEPVASAAAAAVRLPRLASLFRSFACAAGLMGLIVSVVLASRGEQPLLWLAALVPAALAAATLFALAALLDSAADLERRIEVRLERLESLVDQQPQPRAAPTVPPL